MQFLQTEKQSKYIEAKCSGICAFLNLYDMSESRVCGGIEQIEACNEQGQNGKY